MSALPTSVASAIRRDIRNIAEQSGPTNRPDATPYLQPFADDIREALAHNVVPYTLAKNLHKRLAEHVPGLTFRQIYERILRIRDRMRQDGASTVAASAAVKAEPKVAAPPQAAAPHEVPPQPEPPRKEEPRADVVRAAHGDLEKTRAENLREHIQHTQQTDDGTPTRRQSREDLL